MKLLKSRTDLFTGWYSESQTWHVLNSTDLTDYDDDGRAETSEEGGAEHHLHVAREHCQHPAGGEGKTDHQEWAPPATSQDHGGEETTNESSEQRETGQPGGLLVTDAEIKQKSWKTVSVKWNEKLQEAIKDQEMKWIFLNTGCPVNSWYLNKGHFSPAPRR